MTRVERARCILAQVLARESEGRYRYRNSGEPLVIADAGWEAWIHTYDNPARKRWVPKLRPVGSNGFMHRPFYLNRLGLWLSQGPKVLTVEWQNDHLILRTFRRGDWEHQHFGLPRYRGGAALKPYELYRRRSRRW